MTEQDASDKRTRSLEEHGADKPGDVKGVDTKPLRIAVEAEIDAFMRKVGFENPAAHTDENGWRYLQLGSAEGRAGVIEKDGDVYLRVEAMVMDVPSDGDLLLPLMRELLEINFGLALPARVALANNKVWAEVMRHIVEVQAGQVAACVYGAMALADGIDDALMKKYGGTSKKRVPPAAL